MHTIVTVGGEDVGIATLVSAKQGIFVTASHVVSNVSSLKIKRGNRTFSFAVLLRGNNIQRATEDWAIVQITDGTWKDELPLPDLDLVYDLPNAAEFQQAVLLTRGGSFSGLSAGRIGENHDSGQLCSLDSVILVETSRYDKGFSGAPVFLSMPGKIGVFAITSRFETTFDNPDNAETVQLFARISKKIESNEGAGKEIDINVLRDVIKDKIFVKILPIKCIFDQILLQEEMKQRINTMDDGQDVQDVVSSIRLVANAVSDVRVRREKVVFTVNMITQSNFSIVGIVKILGSYFQYFGGFNPQDISTSMPLFLGIVEASQKAAAEALPQSYLDAYITASNIPPEAPGPEEFRVQPTGLSAPGAGNIVETFVSGNDQWLYDAALERIQFDVSSLPPSTLPKDQEISLGSEFSVYLTNDELRSQMSGETRSILTAAATAYLARGLNGAELWKDSGGGLLRKEAVWNAMANLGTVLQHGGVVLEGGGSEVRTLGEKFADAAVTFPGDIHLRNRDSVFDRMIIPGLPSRDSLSTGRDTPAPSIGVP
ncbi:hypothetical protein GHK47_02765 [Sinorhizobium meliloti]|uniref:hypothetical protein n=1 Tax=Rhizobium meliloti TaxID=382 RepID=UPI00129818BD|nr:hypothetical protein [Sinorhizobium meliloti]MQV32042.1 hypothetical protein [Sinorhizobium meliloti]